MGGIPCRGIFACSSPVPPTTCIAASHAASSFSMMISRLSSLSRPCPMSSISMGGQFWPGAFMAMTVIWSSRPEMWICGVRRPGFKAVLDPRQPRRRHCRYPPSSGRYPTTFDGRRLAEERAELDLGDFALQFEVASGYAIDGLASRFRSPDQAHGRVVVSTLAASRYGFRVC